jgi:hypothetical protein
LILVSIRFANFCARNSAGGAAILFGILAFQ